MAVAHPIAQAQPPFGQPIAQAQPLYQQQPPPCPFRVAPGQPCPYAQHHMPQPAYYQTHPMAQQVPMGRPINVGQPVQYAPLGFTKCEDTCMQFTRNGICDDRRLGGSGQCTFGTDCSDCGPAFFPPPPPPPPPSPPPPPPPPPKPWLCDARKSSETNFVSCEGGGAAHPDCMLMTTS